MTTPLDLGPIKEREARAMRGPWRWEINLSSRIVKLCGGQPRYDKTVMDFVRWGMNGAAPRFLRDDGGHLLLTHAKEMTAPVAGREHHENWFRRLVHPDAEFLEHARTDIPLLVAEVERLRTEAEAEERSHGQTIDDRDALHDRIDEIADALGDETECSNVNDRGANAVELAQEALGRLVDLRIAVEPVRSWFDGDGEIATPSDVEIAKMAVEELQKDREEVLRLRAAMNQIIATTSERAVKHMACKAMGVAT